MGREFTIDVDDAEQVERLVPLLFHCGAFPDATAQPMAAAVPRVQAALRSLVEPPRPPEPTGLGAVVEDATGHTWTRTHRPSSVIPGGRKPWTVEIDTGFEADYADIAAVRVLSEGVQP